MDFVVQYRFWALSAGVIKAIIWVFVEQYNSSALSAAVITGQGRGVCSTILLLGLINRRDYRR